MIKHVTASIASIRVDANGLSIQVDGEDILNVECISIIFIDDRNAPEYYGPSGAAKFLGVPTKIFRNLVLRGLIPLGEVRDGIRKYSKETLIEVKEKLA